MPFKSKQDYDNYQKQYYQANKKRLNMEKQKTEYCVNCNKWFYKGYLARHLKTKKHANRVAELIQNKKKN